MNTFEDSFKKATNLSYTANGALAYKTTFKPLLDCNFAVSAARIEFCNSDMLKYFEEAWNDDKILTMLWLFYLRDCRGGLGERDSFRKLLLFASVKDPELVCKVIRLIPAYGRWDDVIYIFDMSIEDSVKNTATDLIRNRIKDDLEALETGDGSISLCAKWLPSCNTSSRETRRKANKLIRALHTTATEYRKTLSKLRKAINITERNLSSKEYENIDYQKVPSRAMLKYTKAFTTKDQTRFTEYLGECLAGNAKMNIAGVSPYEVLKNTLKSDGLSEFYNIMWEFLVKNGFPDSERFGKAISVVDVSASMSITVSGTTTAMDIAISLGLYFSTKLNSVFKDKMITFTYNPSWIDVSKEETPKDKYLKILRSNWGGSTNIEKVFKLILDIAKDENVNPEDMPDTLIIVSDMQFNEAVDYRADKALFDAIREAYHNEGYKLPKLVFWNVAGDAGTIPMIDEGDNGVALISGFNQNAVKVANTDKKDPLDALIEVLMSERYKPVLEALTEED